MFSPAWRVKLCGEIGADERNLLKMDEEDKSHFLKVVALSCGESVLIGSGADSQIDELIGLARMADKYQIEAIQGDVEEAVMDRLTVESCGRILTMACDYV